MGLHHVKRSMKKTRKRVRSQTMKRTTKLTTAQGALWRLQIQALWRSIACAVLLIWAGAAKAEVILAERIRVIDGDTIAVDGQRIRLVGFDTPETHFAQCEYERALGHAATERLAALMTQTGAVELVMLPGRDRYDRGLARLFVLGQDVGTLLIGEGLARVYEGGRRGSWCETPSE